MKSKYQIRGHFAKLPGLKSVPPPVLKRAKNGNADQTFSLPTNSISFSNFII